jgi:proteasome accessory factor A
MVFIGAEREYAPHASSADVLNRLGPAVARRVRHLPGCASSGFYTPMGRHYLDVGTRPEWATIESSDPDDVLRSILVGEMLLREAAADVGLELMRANVDYRGATGACHFNLSCTLDRTIMYDQLLPFFASQVIFGSGGLVPDRAGVTFSLSPRCSSYILKAISLSTDRERGLCHARNEPLSRTGWRAHITGVDTTATHRSTWIRLASAAAVVWAIESGARPAESVRLVDPILAMRDFCRDTSCTCTAATAHHTRVAAIDIQRVYLAAVRSLILRADAPDWLPLLCQRWQRVLDLIRADPSAVTCVDWCIKLKLFQDWARTRHGLDWEELRKLGHCERVSTVRAELTELDLRFGALHPPGLFDQLDALGEFDHGVPGISDTVSIHDMPTRGRAATRAREIARLHGTAGACCEWDGVFDGKGRVMRLPDADSGPTDWTREDSCWTVRHSIRNQAAQLFRSLRARSALRVDRHP